MNSKVTFKEKELTAIVRRVVEKHVQECKELAAKNAANPKKDGEPEAEGADAATGGAQPEDMNASQSGTGDFTTLNSAELRKELVERIHQRLIDEEPRIAELRKGLNETRQHLANFDKRAAKVREDIKFIKELVREANARIEKLDIYHLVPKDPESSPQ